MEQKPIHKTIVTALMRCAEKNSPMYTQAVLDILEETLISEDTQVIIEAMYGYIHDHKNTDIFQARERVYQILLSEISAHEKTSQSRSCTIGTMVDKSRAGDNSAKVLPPMPYYKK